MVSERSPGEGRPVKDKIKKEDLKLDARRGKTLPESRELEKILGSWVENV